MAHRATQFLQELKGGAGSTLNLYYIKFPSILFSTLPLFVSNFLHNLQFLCYSYLFVPLYFCVLCILFVRDISTTYHVLRWVSIIYWYDCKDKLYYWITYTLSHSLLHPAHSTNWKYSTLHVQYSTVPYCTVQHNTIQYSTVQYHTVQYSTV